MAAVPVLDPAPPEAPVLVAYSGGLDSGVLLQLLADDPLVRRRGLRAIHVHHGLHPEADDWARHCERRCRMLGVELEVVAVTVQPDGEGLEAAARSARHRAFAAHLCPGEVLALAHHRNDQAETFLQRALRASGVDGLAAMRAWRSFGPGWMWRPLLGSERGQLLAYARARGLQWVDDPSNDSQVHDRNLLRHRVLPLLETRWPHAGAALAQAAQLQQEALALLEQEDAQALARLRTADPACLHVAPLAALAPPRQARVLRRWTGELGLPPLPAQGVAEAARLLAEGSEARGSFAWQDACIRRWRGLLWAGRPRPGGGGQVHWNGSAPLAWGGGSLRLDPPLAPGEAFPPQPCGTDAPFLVHPRAGGERIALPGRAHTHALKHVLQDLGVPPWERERLPLLSDRAGAVLAAGDLALSASMDAWLRASGRRLRWNANG
jgi:tRNA(Ile)-lysidine synthase